MTTVGLSPLRATDFHSSDGRRSCSQTSEAFNGCLQTGQAYGACPAKPALLAHRRQTAWLCEESAAKGYPLLRCTAHLHTVTRACSVSWVPHSCTLQLSVCSIFDSSVKIMLASRRQASNHEVRLVAMGSGADEMVVHFGRSRANS